MSSNGSANGHGTKKKAWDLKKDGMLWKRVLDYSTKEFQQKAEAFVVQLQESVQPADALQGLLLDRMAASYLRKHLILEAELAAKEYYSYTQRKKHSSEPETMKRAHVAADMLVLQAQASGHVLRYEALLDQGFHRDLILLQKLKEIAPVPDAGNKKSLKPGGPPIEGDSSITHMA